MSIPLKNRWGAFLIVLGLGVVGIGYQLRFSVVLLVGLGLVVWGGIMISPDVFTSSAVKLGDVIGPYVPTIAGRRSTDPVVLKPAPPKDDPTKDGA